jgi:cytochrome c553
MKKDIYHISIHAELQSTTTTDGEKMQSKSKNTQKRNATSCAGCGKTFSQNEKTVSYDFERFYCFHCDDER